MPGRWFDRDELKRANESTDEDLRWLDFDPFAGEAEEPQAGQDARLCPRDIIPMGVITYEKSGRAHGQVLRVSTASG